MFKVHSVNSYMLALDHVRIKVGEDHTFKHRIYISALILDKQLCSSRSHKLNL